MTREEQIKPIGKITPYPYQHDLIEDVKEHIRSQWANFKDTGVVEPRFVEAYVSAGKTIIIGGVVNHCNRVGARTLVLARVGELVKQNAEECWNMDAKNSVFSASLGIKSINYPCIIGTEGTVANALHKKLKGWIPHVILIDECHEVDWREVMKLKADPSYETKNQYAIILCHFMRLNPKVAIIGMTGTPYRGTESIQGPFWKGRVGPRVDREFLVDNGYIVHTVFGYGEYEYDYSEFDSFQDGAGDFSDADLKRMGDKADRVLTHKIMQEVQALTKSRLGVLITCASEKHCQQAAEVLPDGTWAIITSKTKNDDRERYLEQAKAGAIKYVFQIGCLTTGVNVPYWDTSVILRRIGSLTLLTQLLGRGMRLLKSHQVEAGLNKIDHLCLDYSGTMEAMQRMFDNPILEDAILERARKKKTDTKTCPVCQFENSIMARRCVNRSGEHRCGHFWVFKECPKCHMKNDATARECAHCDATIIDPNKALTGKHYGPDDWKKVDSMEMGPTRNGGVYITIKLDCEDFHGNQEVAKLFFNPWSSEGAKRIFQQTFVNVFVASWPDRKRVMAAPNVEALMAIKNLFVVPTEITHRINDKNKSVVRGVKFGEIETMGGKRVA